MSGMPGPWSRATRTRPSLPSSLSMPSVSSPFLAYSRMLRASSEIAVAMRVRWLFEKPICWASARPRWRAVTMSTSESIGTRVSSFKERTLTRGAGPPRLRIHASPRSSAGSAQITSELLLHPPIQERQVLSRSIGKPHGRHVSFDLFQLLYRLDFVAQEPMALLDASMQVADGVHLGQLHADVQQRLRDLGRQSRDDDRGAEKPRGLHRED